MAYTFTIDPEKGVIQRLSVVTGNRSKAGYIRIRYQGKVEYVHRLIWEHVNGPIPKGMHIDHINGDKSDNRISNLRLATPSQNAQNRQNSSGVHLCKSSGKWISQIGHEGKRYFLGRFDTLADAETAYAGAAAILHTHRPQTKKAKGYEMNDQKETPDVVSIGGNQEATEKKQP